MVSPPSSCPAVVGLDLQAAHSWHQQQRGANPRWTTVVGIIGLLRLFLTDRIESELVFIFSVRKRYIVVLGSVDGRKLSFPPHLVDLAVSRGRLLMWSAHSSLIVQPKSCSASSGGTKDTPTPGPWHRARRTACHDLLLFQQRCKDNVTPGQSR